MRICLSQNLDVHTISELLEMHLDTVFVLELNDSNKQVRAFNVKQDALKLGSSLEW